MIELENVSKRYGERVALGPTTLTFTRASTTALIGPSGCGKSTLIRTIVGLVAPDTGEVRIDAARVDDASVERIRHSIGYVLQDGGLFPHLTAAANVTLVAEYLRWKRSDAQARVGELARLVQIPEEALRRFPQQLSGGQRQRVSLMRALMLDPPVLLLDEPLGALDPVTRYELQAELKTIFAELRKTVVLVTHDMGEAVYLADDICVMREGRVIQRGAPREIVESPADEYVRQFVRAQRSIAEAAR